MVKFITSAFLILAGLMLVGIYTLPYLEQRSMDSWLKVPVSLEQAELRSTQSYSKSTGTSNTQYQLTLSYHYQFQGKEYQGSRFRSDNYVSSESNGKKWLKRLRSNPKLTAWVNPKKPSTSVLIKDSPVTKRAFFTGLVSLFIGTLGTLLLFLRHRKKRKQKAL